jgi:hypothetical protein
MLRSYNISRDGYSSEKAKHIIFYGGAYHTFSIEEILLKFGATPMEKSFAYNYNNDYKFCNIKMAKNFIPGTLCYKDCLNIDVEKVFKESII